LKKGRECAIEGKKTVQEKMKSLFLKEENDKEVASRENEQIRSAPKKTN